MPFSCTYHIIEMNSGHVLAAIVITFTVKMFIAKNRAELGQEKTKEFK